MIAWRDTQEYQYTINNPITITGPAGFFHERAQVTFIPSEPNNGIIFETNGVEIPASPDYLIENSDIHSTALCKNNVRVTMIEHVLAAIVGLGISNIKIITLPNGQIPIRDGSSFDFCEAILKSGLKKQNAFKRSLYVSQSLRIQIVDSYAELSPSFNEGTSITAIINFDNPIGVQQIDYKHSSRMFCLGLSWARTFAFKPFTNIDKTIKKFPGFLLTDEKYFINSNMIIYTNDGGYISDVRRCDEPVRHKVLDFIGDTAILGGIMESDIRLYKPGHRLNHEIIKRIWKILKDKGEEKEKILIKNQPRILGDKSEFIRDVTIPDGTIVKVNQKFIKTWEIQNVGNIIWKNRYLKREGPANGPGKLKSKYLVKVPVTEPGQNVQISVTFTAPNVPGTYYSEWKMVDEDGNLFFKNQKPLHITVDVIY